MDNRRLKPLLMIFVLLSLIMNACQTNETPSISEPAFEPLVVSAQNCNYGGDILQVAALDRYTVQFTLCMPDPAFASKLANPVFSIQDKDYLDETKGDSELLSENVVGTGPYLLRDYRPGTYLFLEVNPSYWDVPPRAKNINFTWSKDPLKRFDKLDNGQADLIDLLPPSDIANARGRSDVTLHFRPPLNVLYLGFNNTIEPFNNEIARKAIATGINQQDIINFFLPEGSELADQLIPRILYPGHTGGLGWYDFNVLDSQRLLAEAGVAEGTEITLYYTIMDDPSKPDIQLIAENIKQQLSFVGLNVSLNQLPQADFDAALEKGALGFFINYDEGDYPDASYFYDTLFTSSNQSLGRHYSDLVIEINRAEQITDAGIRQSYYDTVNALMNEHVPLIPIAYMSSVLANRSSLENVVVGPMNENLVEMSNLSNKINFMQATEPESLWPADEVAKDTLRVTSLLYDTLVKYAYNSTSVEPSLADSWTTNSDLTQWTFNLRYNVKFSNGADFDANDVVASFAAIWDASSQNHTGRTGNFEIYRNFFGNFLNAE